MPVKKLRGTGKSRLKRGADSDPGQPRARRVATWQCDCRALALTVVARMDPPPSRRWCARDTQPRDSTVNSDSESDSTVGVTVTVTVGVGNWQAPAAPAACSGSRLPVAPLAAGA